MNFSLFCALSLHNVTIQAIDFGTTYSGYAFSFIHDPDDIHMMRKWEGWLHHHYTLSPTVTSLFLKIYIFVFFKGAIPGFPTQKHRLFCF